MDLVSLFDQADKGSPHRNHIIIRMWRKDENALRENIVMLLWPIARHFLFLRFATWPSGDCGLKVAEDRQIDIVSHPMFGQKILKAFLVVVLFG